MPLLAGLTNFVYLVSAQWYPLFSFSTLHSLFYHFSMVFIGAFLIATGYHKPSWSDLWKGMVPILMFSLLVLPILATFPGSDYMLYNNGSGLPVLSDMAQALREKNLHFLFVYFIMFIGYPLATLVSMGLVKALRLLFGKVFGLRRTAE